MILMTAKTMLAKDSMKLLTDEMKEADGILSIPAVIARQMVYQYDTLKALKPFEELEAAARFADGIPVTLEHPPAGVVTDRAEVLGFLKNPIAENDELKGMLEISNKDLIADIKGGVYTDVSPGFFCELDHTAGTLDSAEYDAVQRKIFLNHVAVCKTGRCSLEDGCGLNTDSVDSPPDLIGKFDTAIGMAANEYGSTALKDLLVEMKEMVTAGSSTDSAAITAERDALKAELEKIVKTEKDALIAELVAAQDAKTQEDLEKLKLDELKKELDMVNELRTDHLVFQKGKQPAQSAVDAAYAGVGR